MYSLIFSNFCVDFFHLFVSFVSRKEKPGAQQKAFWYLPKKLTFLVSPPKKATLIEVVVKVSMWVVRGFSTSETLKIFDFFFKKNTFEHFTHPSRPPLEILNLNLFIDPSNSTLYSTSFCLHCARSTLNHSTFSQFAIQETCMCFMRTCVVPLGSGSQFFTRVLCKFRQQVFSRASRRTMTLCANRSSCRATTKKTNLLKRCGPQPGC